MSNYGTFSNYKHAHKRYEEAIKKAQDYKDQLDTAEKALLELLTGHEPVQFDDEIFDIVDGKIVIREKTEILHYFSIPEKNPAPPEPEAPQPMIEEVMRQAG